MAPPYTPNAVTVQPSLKSDAQNLIYSWVVPVVLSLFLLFLVFNFIYAYNVSAVAKLTLDFYLQSGLPIAQELYMQMVVFEKSTLFSSPVFLAFSGILSVISFFIFQEKHYKVIKTRGITLFSSVLLIVCLLISGLGICLYNNKSLFERATLSGTSGKLLVSNSKN